MRRALFPGRFQPFHKGHLMVVQEILGEYDEVVIVVGSAQEGFTCKNPFTAGERIEMIDLTLRGNGYSRDQYMVVPVPDLNKPLAWTSYVLGLVPRINVVFSGNPHTIYLYKWLGIPVREIKLYDPNRFSGTNIRSLMCRGGEWEELVPKEIADYIKSINGVERVRRVCSVEGSRDRWKYG